MSLETWKAEYYPIPADETEKENAIAHSLKKWEGLRISNLAMHSLFINDSGGIEDEDGIHLDIDAGSCALCLHAYGEGCNTCPLFLARGKVSCDNVRSEEDDSPWHTWCEDRDPRPMIHWLRKAHEATSHDAHGPDKLLYGGTAPANVSTTNHAKPPIGGLTCETPAKPGILDSTD